MATGDRQRVGRREGASYVVIEMNPAQALPAVASQASAGGDDSNAGSGGQERRVILARDDGRVSAFVFGDLSFSGHNFCEIFKQKPATKG